MEAAAYQTLMLDWASIVAWVQHFPEACVPLAPALPPQGLVRKSAKEFLKSSKALPTFRGRSRALDRATVEWMDRLQQEHHIVAARLREAAQGFNSLDQGLNLLAIHAAFSDNGIPAIGIDLQGATLIVLLLFPSAEQLVWPEKATTTAGGVLSVKPRAKSEMFAEHARLLIRYVFASAKEALCVQPKLTDVRVLVVDEQDQQQLSRRRVFADVTINRQDLDRHRVDNSWQESWNSVLTAWESTNTDSADLIAERLGNFIRRHSHVLSAADARLITDLAPRVAVNQNANGELVHMDFLGALLPDVDHLPIDVDGDPRPIDALGDSPDELNDVDFWLEALLVSQQWTRGLANFAAQQSQAPVAAPPSTAARARPLLGTHVRASSALPSSEPAQVRPRLNVSPIDPT